MVVLSVAVTGAGSVFTFGSHGGEKKARFWSAMNMIRLRDMKLMEKKKDDRLSKTRTKQTLNQATDDLGSAGRRADKKKDAYLSMVMPLLSVEKYGRVKELLNEASSSVALEGLIKQLANEGVNAVLSANAATGGAGAAGAGATTGAAAATGGAE